jgi:competence protein ComGC
MNSNSKGFSKIELILVILIIGTLAFVLLPVFNSLNKPTPPTIDNSNVKSLTIWNPGAESNQSETPVSILPQE